VKTLLDIIPNYAEAVGRERFIRDAAFLGVTETVAGYELKPFTLRHYLVLRIAKNPVIYGDIPDPIELAQFLWICSADYCLSDRKRRAFLKRCRAFNPTRPLLFKTARWQRGYEATVKRFADTLTAAREYVAEASMDKPASRKNSGWHPDYYSEAAFWVSLFKYRYTPDEVLDMPMKVLFQMLQEARERNESKPVMCNPSDRIRLEFMRQSNPTINDN